MRAFRWARVSGVRNTMTRSLEHYPEPTMLTSAAHSPAARLASTTRRVNSCSARKFLAPGRISRATTPASAASRTPCSQASTAETEIHALAAFTGRAGFAFNRALVYAKGGVAWDSRTDIFNTVAAGVLLGTPGALLNSKSSNWGYTVGAGVEYALISNWSAALEYNYYDFGKSTAFTTTIPPGLANVNLAPNNTTIHAMSLEPELQVQSDDIGGQIN